MSVICFGAFLLLPLLRANLIFLFLRVFIALFPDLHDWLQTFEVSFFLDDYDLRGGAASLLEVPIVFAPDKRNAAGTAFCAFALGK